MRLSKTLISCVAMIAVTAVSEVASGQNYNVTLKIVNNFAEKTLYFDDHVPDEHFWLLYTDQTADTTSQKVKYGPNGTPWNMNTWLQLSALGASADNGHTATLQLAGPYAALRMYAAISTTIPTSMAFDPTSPTTFYNNNMGLAYQIFEWTLTGLGDDTYNQTCGFVDSSYVDQFSFPTTLIVKDFQGTTTNRSGFKDDATASELLSSLSNIYGTNLPANSFIPYNTPQTISQNWYTQPGVLTNFVTTSAGGIGNNPFRFASPSKSPLTKLPSTNDSVAQCFESYQELLDKLYHDPINSLGGFYFESVAYGGFAFNLIIVKSDNGSGPLQPSPGYGVKLTNFRLATDHRFSQYATPLPGPDNGLGQPYAGSVLLAPDGVILEDWRTAGVTGTQYGLWTTLQLLLGNAMNTTTTACPGASSGQDSMMTIYPPCDDSGLSNDKICLTCVTTDAWGPNGLAWIQPPVNTVCFNAIVSDAIGRVATAMSYGMQITTYEQSQATGGFKYVSKLGGALSTTGAQGGQLTPALGGTAQCTYPRPDGSTYRQNGLLGPVNVDDYFYKMGAEPNGGTKKLGSGWVQGLQVGYSTNDTASDPAHGYTVPPYTTPYSDNFGAVNCSLTEWLYYSPNIPVPGGVTTTIGSLVWELGVGTAVTCPPSCGTQLWSDINNDGATDGSDVTLLLQAWGTNQQAFDFDSSGVVDSQDLSRLLSHLGDSALLATTVPAVPEWATLMKCCPPENMCDELKALINESGFAWKVRDNTTLMPMVLIPAGTFDMGCTSSTGSNWRSPCAPWEYWNSGVAQEQVPIGNHFYMGEFEVTQAEYKRVMNANPSTFTGATNLPVENVSYDMIAGPGGFLAKVNGTVAQIYNMRLPTEPEWEYACRAQPNTNNYSPSAFSSALGSLLPCQGTSDDSSVTDLAWCAQNSIVNGIFTTHADVPKYRNGFGLANMLGNVWEWTDTQFAGQYSSNPNPSPGANYVLRGGYWSNQINNTMYPLQLTNFVRSSYRGSAAATDKGNDNGQTGRFGFRVVRTAVLPPPQLED